MNGKYNSTEACLIFFCQFIITVKTLCVAVFSIKLKSKVQAGSFLSSVCLWCLSERLTGCFYLWSNCTQCMLLCRIHFVIGCFDFTRRGKDARCDTSRKLLKHCQKPSSEQHHDWSSVDGFYSVVLPLIHLLHSNMHNTIKTDKIALNIATWHEMTKPKCRSHGFDEGNVIRLCESDIFGIYFAILVIMNARMDVHVDFSMAHSNARLLWVFREGVSGSPLIPVIIFFNSLLWAVKTCYKIFFFFFLTLNSHFTDIECKIIASSQTIFFIIRAENVPRWLKTMEATWVQRNIMWKVDHFFTGSGHVYKNVLRLVLLPSRLKITALLLG